MEKSARKKKIVNVVEAVVEPVVEAAVEPVVEAVVEPRVLTEKQFEDLVNWFYEFTATVVVLNLPAKVWIENNDIQVTCCETDVPTINELLGVTKRIVAEREALVFKVRGDLLLLQAGVQIEETREDRSGYTNVTKGGEITVDENEEYTVWDETNSSEIFKTKNLALAFQRLSEYSAFLSNGYGEKPIELIDAV